MKKRSSRRSLVMSAIAFVLCATMLLGTTFAWFSDSVTSANNVIQAGNLDVTLSYKNDETSDWTEVNTGTNIFKANTLWEPGHAEVVKLKVSNTGKLAFKYQLGVNVVSEVGSVNKDGADFVLSDYIYYGVQEGEKTYSDSVAAIAAVENGAKKISVDYDKADFILADGADQIVTLVVYMPTTVGNEANYGAGKTQPSINLGIELVATQKDSEQDSFGSDYDKGATYPTLGTTTIPSGGATTSTPIESGDVVVDLPAQAPEGNYTLEVLNAGVTTDDTTGETTVSYDITLVKDGTKVTEAAGVTYTVSIELPKALNITKVMHNDSEVTSYNYDPATGILTFETASFSPFKVVYNNGFAGGTGTEEDPYLISTLDHMRTMGNMYNGYNYFKVADGVTEIDVMGGTVNASLCGNFDGNGVTFKNVSSRLFRNVYGAPDMAANKGSAVIKNFTVEFNKAVGGVVYYNLAHNLTLDNVTVKGSIEATYNVSSFIDYAGVNNQSEHHITISNCRSLATIIMSGGDVGGFVGHPYSNADSTFTITNSTFEGELYSSSGVNGCKFFTGVWVNGTVTVDGEVINGNSLKYNAEKSHAIKVVKGTLPEKYTAFTAAKEADYDHAEATLIIGPNGNGTTVIGGYYCGDYIVEEPVVSDDSLVTDEIKYFDIYCNAEGATETGVSADGKEFHIVNDKYNDEIGGASVRLVQYNAANEILSVTVWTLK